MNQMVSIVKPGAGNGVVIPPANQLDQHEKFVNELPTKQEIVPKTVSGVQLSHE